MTPTPVTSLRITFDKERKLKARHKFIREAVRTSGKAITELLQDPFGGFPYLVQALLQPGAPINEPITIDKASDLIDAFVDNGGRIEDLQSKLVLLLQSYMRIEVTPTPDEEEKGDPNAATPVAPGPSSD